jgi:hypothetical protein
MQSAFAHPFADRTVAQPESQQLLSRHHPVLPPGKHRKPGIERDGS